MVAMTVTVVLRRARLHWLFLPSILTWFGCDPSYRPEFCNGFERPIVLEVVYQDSHNLKGSLPPKTCLRERTAGLEYKSLSIETPEGKRFATYTEDILKRLIIKESPENIHLLATERGLFLVPKEFRYNWRDHITEIEKTGSALNR
jgi:hypothetical protein